MTANSREYQREYMRKRRAKERAEREALLEVDTPPLVAVLDRSVFDVDHYANWCQSTLIVPSGILQGKPYEIEQWQIDFVREAYSDGVRESLLSTPRKNGKTGLIGSLLLYFLTGAARVANWRGVATSLTGRLAAELRGQIADMIKVANIESVGVLKSPPPGRIEGIGGAVDLLAADKSTGHASGADLALIDEGGLLEEKDRPLWDAMTSCVSSRDGRFMVISVRGESPMVTEMIDSAADLKSVIVHVYGADNEADIHSPDVWHEANPGLGTIKSLSYMADKSEKVKRNRRDEPGFRSLELNISGVADREPICTVEEWNYCTGDEAPRGDWCIVAFDAGGARAMTAGAIYWPQTYRLDCLAAFPGLPKLDERSETDGVGETYSLMEETGELFTFLNAHTTDIPEFLRRLSALTFGARVVAFVSDRYRQSETKTGLADSKVGWDSIAVFRGTGKHTRADGSADVRAFERAVIERRIRYAKGLHLMRHAISDSAIQRDSLGNPALDKARARGRIDVLQAAVLAVGYSAVYRSKPKQLYTAPRVKLTDRIALHG